VSDELPTVVAVRGVLAESASWNGVIERLHSHSVEVIAAANPLRSLPATPRSSGTCSRRLRDRSSWSGSPTATS
jgi:hypothetical protein